MEMIKMCGCATCVKERAFKEKELQEKEIKERDEKSRNTLLELIKELSGDSIEENSYSTKSTETEKEIETSSKTIIKKLVYSPTRQYFSETNTYTGEIKEDYFRVPLRKETVIHSGNRTIVILDDGTKGIAKLHPFDNNDNVIGIKIAYTRAKIKLLQKELKKLTR